MEVSTPLADSPEYFHTSTHGWFCEELGVLEAPSLIAEDYTIRVSNVTCFTL